MSVQLRVRQEGAVSVVDVSGRLTLGDGVNTLRSVLSALVNGGHKRILLNLGELSHLDSSGFGVLVSSFVTLNNLRGELKLVNPTNHLKDLLQLSKLYTVFEVYEDEAVAVRSFT